MCCGCRASSIIAALRGALNELVRRHEVLRTRFGMQDGQPVQVIAPELTIALAIEDLRECAPDERASEAQRRAQAEARGALRSRARAAHSGAAIAFGALRALVAAHPASHRHRRLVIGRAEARAHGAVQRLSPGRAVAAAGVAGAVRRLCAVAAAVAAGRGARAAAGVLAASARRVADAGAADGSAAPGGGELPGRVRQIRSPGVADAFAQGARPARGRDAVHDAARGLPGPALSLQRAGGHRGRGADRGAHPAGAGGADRVLRQHAGAARRPVGRAELHERTWRGCGSGRWTPTRTRTCRSRSWWRSWRRSATCRAIRCSR